MHQRLESFLQMFAFKDTVVNLRQSSRSGQLAVHRQKHKFSSEMHIRSVVQLFHQIANVFIAFRNC